MNVVFNRRKGTTATYDQALIDLLENWGFTVTVVDDAAVSTTNYSDKVLLIIGAPDGDWVANHTAETFLKSLNLPIISMCRGASRNSLELATNSGLNTEIRAMTVVDETHPIMLNFKAYNGDRIGTTINIDSVHSIYDLIGGAVTICHQGRTLDTRFGLVERIGNGKSKIHFGCYQFDQTTVSDSNLNQLFKCVVERCIGANVTSVITTLKPETLDEKTLNFRGSISLGVTYAETVGFRYRILGSLGDWIYTPTLEVGGTEGDSVKEFSYLVNGIDTGFSYEVQAYIPKTGDIRVLFNRRKGVTDNYDQAVIDLLIDWGVSSGNIDIVDDANVMTYTGNADLMIVGAPDSDNNNNPDHLTYVETLNIPIISFCRGMSRFYLYMSNNSSGSAGRSGLRFNDMIHPITRALNVRYTTGHPTLYLTPTNELAQIISEPKPQVRFIACNRTTSIISTADVGLGELIRGGKPKIHIGHYRVDLFMESGKEFLKEVIEHCKIDVISAGHSFYSERGAEYGEVEETYDVKVDKVYQQGNQVKLYYNIDRSDRLLGAGDISRYRKLGEGTLNTSSTLDNRLIRGGTTKAIKSLDSASHTLIIRSDNTLWGFGRDSNGQLGQGVLMSSTFGRFTPIQIMSPSTFKAIACGYHHSLVIRSDNTLWGFGYDGNGQLGQGSTAHSRPTPVQIMAGFTFKSIDSSYEHSLAIRSDGTLWGFGGDGNGELGQGTTALSRSTPVQIMAGSTFKAISCGYKSSLALRSDGTLWGFGEDGYGQFGQGGTTIVRSTPVQIMSPSTFKDMSTGGFHSIFIRSDNTLWGSGADGYGQLGQGTTLGQTFTPVQIMSGSTFKYVDVCEDTSLVIRSDDTLWGFGRDSYGQLGQQTISNKPTPVQLFPNYKIKSVSSDDYNTLAITSGPFFVPKWRDNTVSGIYCPYGAEGYDLDGNLVISLESEGWMKEYTGQVVFKLPMDYGNVDCIPGLYEVLSLAGGGSGGSYYGGGGGAGGLIYYAELPINSSLLLIVVGKGAPTNNTSDSRGVSGSNTIFGGLESTGGGGGGGRSTTNPDGLSGGSGGGAGDTTTSTGGSGQLGQGYAGGNSVSVRGCGGGGAFEVGEDSGDFAGAGGDGLSFFGTYYAGGGGGRGGNSPEGQGGLGGGGNGGAPGDDGANFLGAGGGGNATAAGGGAGGSGIVIVRWGGYSHNYNPTA